MYVLFPTEPRYPNGFSYNENFLTTAEEDQLLTFIQQVEFHSFIFQGYTAKRRVASFGFDYNFNNRSITVGKEIPSELFWLMQKVAPIAGVSHEAFQELLITEYPEGAVINWHRDAPPFDLIAGISLLSDCKFKLRPYKKELQTKGSTISIPVNRRSLYLIAGEARTAWEHSIAPVEKVRYSITLRTLR